MLKITKSIVCPHCGKDMNTYSTNEQTKRLLFTCPKGHTTELTETEYYKMINVIIRGHD